MEMTGRARRRPSMKIGIITCRRCRDRRGAAFFATVGAHVGKIAMGEALDFRDKER